MPQAKPKTDSKASPVQEALRPVAKALARGQSNEASQAFLQAVKQLPVPQDGALLDIVRESLGKQNANKLIAALAGFACPYCTRGFEKCALCGGSGRAESSQDACVTCMGLGGTRCTFCSGSGWATYTFFPSGLRPAIATARCNWAVQHAEQPIRPPKGTAANGPSRQRKIVASEVAELSRVLAALRNAMELARGMHREPESRRLARQLFVRCEKSAKAVQKRLAESHAKLASVSNQLAEQTTDEDRARFERDRAKLFEREAKRMSAAAKRRTSLLLSRR
jgi:hypothetical protein